jgi:glutamine---fructose-6-phosphate transaminase (isomerizing)
VKLVLSACTAFQIAFFNLPSGPRFADRNLPKKCRVIYLEDNDIVHMRPGGYAIFNRTGLALRSTQVRRTIHTLTMEVSQIMKGGYDHYMQKEIFEQPETIAQTMRGRVTMPLECTAMHKSYTHVTNAVHLGGLTDHVPTIRRSRRLMFIGCGTSYHAAMCARQTVEELCEIPVVLELASDLLDRRCPLFRDDTCIFVSQSGETADTMRALEYAKVSGALCLGITNTVGSAIARNTHAGIHINAGAEIGVASTKAYTSQIVAITMMALVLSEDTISKRQRRDEIIHSMINLPDAIGSCLKLDKCIRKLAEELKDEPNLLIFGRGRNYATAMEGALKVKEISYMHSEGLNAGEMKHGPLALVDETMPIILVCTMDEMYSKMQGVLQQLMARNARLIILCHQGDKDVPVVAGHFFPLIKVPKVDDALQPVVNIIPLQLLSYHLTLLRGYNVDQPRNLAKSVTVTEE